LCAQKQADREKPLKIGVILSMTGPFSPVMRSIVDGVKPMEELLNRRGGVTVKGHKYRVELVLADDQSSPPGAVSAVNKLIQDDIKFVLPPGFIPNILAVMPIIKEAKMLGMKAFAPGQEVLNPNTPFMFASSAVVYNPRACYDHLKRRYPKVKRVALVTAADPGLGGWLKLVRNEIQRNGFDLVSDESFKIGAEDYYPILTKTLEKRPDAIDIVGSIEPWSAGIITQSRELGFKGPVMCSTSIMGDINIVNSMIDPKNAYDVFHADIDPLGPNVSPIVKEFRSIVEQKTGRPLYNGQVATLDCIYILLQGIERAQSFDVDKVTQALEGTKSIDTVYGKGRMAGEDLFGINHAVRRTIFISGITNGKVWCEATDKD
jgi:branched-chain amino acid transport system substrate-binding protein